MADTTYAPEPNVARYHVGRGQNVSVGLLSEVDGKQRIVVAKLIHISSVEARLRSREPINLKEIVGLQLRTEHPEHTILLSGEVYWMEPANGDYWWVGCSFDPAIPDEVLEQFAESGILERRQYNREKVKISTVAKWELNSPTARAHIVDYSRGGLCLRSQDKGKPGERLLLEFRLQDGREFLVRATARWQVETEKGYVIGCQFLDDSDYSVFRDLKALKDQTGPVSFWVWRWLGGT